MYGTTYTDINIYNSNKYVCTMCKLPRVSCWKRGITSTNRGSFQPDSRQLSAFV